MSNKHFKYAADGQKLREKHTTAVDGLTVSYGQTLELTPAQIMAVDTTDYSGPWMFRRRGNPNVTYLDAMSYHFDGGYITFYPVPVPSSIPNLPPVYNYVSNYHYYIRDYQGNNRVVVAPDGTVEQTNDYYAYGGPWGDTSYTQGFQPFKYNGKELDRVHGLDWYDYGARRYDPAFAQFTQMDPLCEKYPHLSPYAYCAGNPVRYVDPDGMRVEVIKNADGSYRVTNVIVDGDLNIYDVSGGWENRVSIGEAMTQFSFTNDDGSPVKDSVIDLNDKSGQEFWNNFQTWAPLMPLAYYVFNALPNNKYDFKQKDKSKHKDIDDNQYSNRGMKVNIDGNEYIASARDIGTYVAGYEAGYHGLTWLEARFGFDMLETKNKGGLSIEGKQSQSAQFKGYLQGLKHISIINALKVRLIEYKILKALKP